MMNISETESFLWTENEYHNSIWNIFNSPVKLTRQNDECSTNDNQHTYSITPTQAEGLHHEPVTGQRASIHSFKVLLTLLNRSSFFFFFFQDIIKIPIRTGNDSQLI